MPKVDKSSVVYALTFNVQNGTGKDQTNTAKVLFFAKRDDRDDFITQNISYYFDYGAVRSAFDGVPEGMNGTRGVFKDYRLKELLQKNQVFTFQFKASAKECFAYVERLSEADWRMSYTLELKERNKIFENKTLTDRTAYINEQANLT